MSMHETIEFFPLFDPETAADTPGNTVAVGTGVAAVGAPDALAGGGALVIYLYSAELNGWGYVGVMMGSNVGGSMQVRGLGSSLLAVGNTLVVGAKGDDQSPGRVFVLKPPYDAWTYTAVPVFEEILPRGSAKADMFGSSLAYCSDGTSDYLAVGAPGAAPPVGATGKGQVYIYQGLAGTTNPWSASPIGNPNPAAGESDLFGNSVALAAAADGTLILAVGAPGASEGQGAVYAGQTKQAGSWTPIEFEPAIEPSFPEAAEDFRTSGFGATVALTGSSLLIGSPNDPNLADQIEGTGAVWIYNRADGAFAPSEDRLYGPAQDARFGQALTCSGATPESPATHVLVGAPGAGAAFRYQRDADGKFTADGELVRADGKKEGDFGASVAISSYQHGTWCMVGAPGNPKGGLDGGGFLYAEGDPAPVWLDNPTLISEPSFRWCGLNPDWWQKYTPRITKYLF